MVNEIGVVDNLRLENQLTELASPYGKHPYQSWQFDNQYRKQPFWLGPSQGSYVAQRFGPSPNAPQGQAGYQQSSLQYEAPPFQQ
ncbi:hypothetical protein CR513_12882, partial [Mucuna pruriens]